MTLAFPFTRAKSALPQKAFLSVTEAATWITTGNCRDDAPIIEERQRVGKATDHDERTQHALLIEVLRQACADKKVTVVAYRRHVDPFDLLPPWTDTEAKPIPFTFFEVVHSHLLLHLPSKWREGVRRDVTELAALVAKRILDDRTLKLTFPANPDGKYLLKGGTPAVWDALACPINCVADLERV